MICFIFFFIHAFSYEENASCVILPDGEPKITRTIDTNADAWAYWNNSIFEIGWYKLHIEGREGSDPYNMLRCAGLLEGYLSQHEIYLHFQLIKDIHNFKRDEPYSENWKYFMEKNMNYTFHSIEAYVDSSYWQDINFTITQFNGLVDGYKLRQEERGYTNETMTPLDFWFLEAECELYDIESALSQKRQKVNGPTNGEDCTGLIRLLPDYSDIFFSQDTWSDFRDLHGELKEYHFPIPQFKANRVMFSTRVGKLFSYDDFYIADSGLLVLETTMSIFNMSLYDLVVPESLLTWLRAVRSMWMTDNGPDWTTEFIKHNSGTLNNQYLILDTKKFVRNEKPKKDLLWMIEQYPGDYEKKDLTELLVNNGYFPSINVPFTERLYKKAGYPDKVRSMGDVGDYFSYYNSSRFKILDRESRRITTFDEFIKLMTYNNWKRDPYSKSDPAQAIMSRYDLRRSGEPYGAGKAFGGLDSKCCRVTEFSTKMLFHAIASPAKTENNTPWEFGKPPYEDIRYEGLPALWDFNWTTFQSLTFDLCSNNSEKECVENNDLCGWCTYSQTCLPGDKSGPFFDVKCEDGWKVKQTNPKWAAPVIISISVIIVIFVLVVFISHYIHSKNKKLF